MSGNARLNRARDLPYVACTSIAWFFTRVCRGRVSHRVRLHCSTVTPNGIRQNPLATRRQRMFGEAHSFLLRGRAQAPCFP